MSRPAKVKSIDAVERLAAALARFQEEAAAALTDLQLQVQRAADWIHNDRRIYWTEQVRRGWERVAQAKTELEQARTYRRIAEHQPACREERKALEIAKRRLQNAEEKVEAVRHWTRMLDRAMVDYRGGIAPLARWLEIDLPKATAALKRMGRSLESYVALETPLEETTPEQAGASEQEAASSEREAASSEREAATQDGADQETPP